MWRDTVGRLLVQDLERLGLPKWTPPKTYRRLQILVLLLSHSRTSLFYHTDFFIDRAYACALGVTFYAQQTRMCIRGCLCLRTRLQVHRSGLRYIDVASFHSFDKLTRLFSAQEWQEGHWGEHRDRKDCSRNTRKEVQSHVPAKYSTQFTDRYKLGSRNVFHFFNS